MYYVYVLVSEDGKRYIGLTRNLRRRLEEHNRGESRATKGRKWKLVYYEAYLDGRDARRREKRLKQDGRARYALMKRIEGSIDLVG